MGKSFFKNGKFPETQVSPLIFSSIFNVSDGRNRKQLNKVDDINIRYLLTFITIVSVQGEVSHYQDLLSGEGLLFTTNMAFWHCIV